MEHYTKSNYYQSDPVAAWCRNTLNPFEWSEVPIDSERCPEAVEVMDAARDYGLKKGFLVPILRSSGFQACVTMAGERPDYEPRAKQAIHLMSMYAHARCAALVSGDGGRFRQRTLTDRERDVLAWVAEGKSSWEIGEILGVTERTVNFHADQARKKLDAVTRPHAVSNLSQLSELTVA
jgi:LuxR family quorum sensing-dependent transcriptional regulator